MLDVDKRSPAGVYDPSTHRLLSFYDVAAKFRDGSDTPQPISSAESNAFEALEFAVMAFALGAQAADEFGARCKAGQPLGVVDGMPLGVQLLGPLHGDERLIAVAR